VEYPIDVSTSKDEDFKRWYYVSYNFTMATFWSPYLVKYDQPDTDGPTHTGIFSLYLDEFDENWVNHIDEFSYLILNGGHWFSRPAFYYENRKVVGCKYCQKENITDYPGTFGFRRALRTAFKGIMSRKNFKGVTMLRAFAPTHFEGGEWNAGGDCTRKKPYKSSQVTLDGTNLELYLIQMEEFKKAQRKAVENGLKFRLMDITQPLLLRPDGHPSKYGHWPNENVALYNDCVHWCLPGPIDTLSDFLLHMVKMEGRRSAQEKLDSRLIKGR
ncbi:trichome birefringence-like protein 19, partial [Tanacetum coccineum]